MASILSLPICVKMVSYKSKHHLKKWVTAVKPMSRGGGRLAVFWFLCYWWDRYITLITSCGSQDIHCQTKQQDIYCHQISYAPGAGHYTLHNTNSRYHTCHCDTWFLVSTIWYLIWYHEITMWCYYSPIWWVTWISKPGFLMGLSASALGGVNYGIIQIAALVVNYGISNTTVLEIP